MQTELVERKRWIAQAPFTAGLNFAMLLPGPEAQQLATFIGWRLHGLKGALAAGGLFVLPGAILLGLLAWLAAAHGETKWVAALFDGFRPVVVAIIIVALWRIAKRSLKGALPWVLALAAFGALAFARLPFPLVIGAALAIGAISARLRPGLFSGGHGTVPDTPPPPHAGGWGRIARLVAIFAVLWALPVAAVIWALGPDPWAGIATLFTKAAFVTFGGAYAVLPYVAAEAVEHYAWLSAASMIDGLALAETTPGPLILVTQWIGWFAGFARAGALDPVLAGIIGAALTTYVTFLPCFLFILAGAPYVERVARNRYAAAALGAVTAAVVGVIASLGLYIGRVTLFPPALEGGLDIPALLMALAALALLAFTRLGIPWLVLLGGAAGVALTTAGF